MKILQIIKKFFCDLFLFEGLKMYIQLYYKQFSTFIGEVLAIVMFAVLGLGLVGDERGLLFALIYIFGQVSILDFYVKKQKKMCSKTTHLLAERQGFEPW